MLLSTECVAHIDLPSSHLTHHVRRLCLLVSDPDPHWNLRMSTESARVIPNDAGGLTGYQATLCKTGSSQHSHTSDDILQNGQTIGGSNNIHVETAGNRMGIFVSKLVTSLDSNQRRNDSNTAAIIELSRDSEQNPMAPGMDELPSPTNSTTSLDGNSGNSAIRSSVLWPYTDLHTAGECCWDDNHVPLRMRRPALYWEYWADERSLAGTQQHTCFSVTADECTVGEGERGEGSSGISWSGECEDSHSKQRWD